jgi:hypothetical protein
MPKSIERAELDLGIIPACLDVDKGGARIQVVVLISDANSACRQVDPFGCDSIQPLENADQWDVEVLRDFAVELVARLRAKHTRNHLSIDAAAHSDDASDGQPVLPCYLEPNPFIVVRLESFESKDVTRWRFAGANRTTPGARVNSERGPVCVFQALAGDGVFCFTIQILHSHLILLFSKYTSVFIVTDEIRQLEVSLSA